MLQDSVFEVLTLPLVKYPPEIIGMDIFCHKISRDIAIRSGASRNPPNAEQNMFERFLWLVQCGSAIAGIDKFSGA